MSPYHNRVFEWTQAQISHVDVQLNAFLVLSQDSFRLSCAKATFSITEDSFFLKSGEKRLLYDQRLSCCLAQNTFEHHQRLFSTTSHKTPSSIKRLFSTTLSKTPLSVILPKTPSGIIVKLHKTPSSNIIFKLHKTAPGHTVSSAQNTFKYLQRVFSAPLCKTPLSVHQRLLSAVLCKTPFRIHQHNLFHCLVQKMPVVSSQTRSLVYSVLYLSKRHLAACPLEPFPIVSHD